MAQSLMDLVADEMANENCQKDPQLVAFYNNTLAHIAHVKAKRADESTKQTENLAV